MPENDYRTHEILLENRHLAFIGAGVLVLCVGSFLVGRWTERSRWVDPDTAMPQLAGAAGDLPIEGGPLPSAAPADAGAEEIGEEDEGEAPAAPAIEPAASTSRSEPPAPEPRAEKARQGAVRGDDLYIQVLATRHSDAARALRDRLAGRDYPVAVVSSPDAQGRPLYRVRVGGYGSREEAERVAARLEKEERLKTWIP